MYSKPSSTTPVKMCKWWKKSLSKQTPPQPPQKKTCKNSTHLNVPATHSIHLTIIVWSANTFVCCYAFTFTTTTTTTKTGCIYFEQLALCVSVYSWLPMRTRNRRNLFFYSVWHLFHTWCFNSNKIVAMFTLLKWIVPRGRGRGSEREDKEEASGNFFLGLCIFISSILLYPSFRWRLRVEYFENLGMPSTFVWHTNTQCCWIEMRFCSEQTDTKLLDTIPAHAQLRAQSNRQSWPWFLPLLSCGTRYFSLNFDETIRHARHLICGALLLVLLLLSSTASKSILVVSKLVCVRQIGFKVFNLYFVGAKSEISFNLDGNWSGWLRCMFVFFIPRWCHHFRINVNRLRWHN